MATPVAPAGATVGPLDIWTALRGAGLSAIQAAGIMGNMKFESGLNPESNGMDTNGYRSYGLIQWNAHSFPNASSLVTGNPQADLKSQVAFLQSTGGFAAAQGATAGEVGSNFAHSYERCAACGYQGGSAQLTERAAAAEQFYAQAQSGNWGTTGGGNTTGGAPGAAGQQGAGTSGVSGCAISMPSLGPIGGGCIISNSNLKALKGGLLIVAGGLVFGMGALVLAAYGFQHSGAAKGATKALRATPAGRVTRTATKATGGSTRRTATPRSPARRLPDRDDLAARRAARQPGPTRQSPSYRRAARGTSTPGPAARRTRRPAGRNAYGEEWIA